MNRKRSKIKKRLRSGNPKGLTKAIEHYEKFLSLWKDADLGIAEVDDARERVAGIKSSMTNATKEKLKGILGGLPPDIKVLN